MFFPQGLTGAGFSFMRHRFAQGPYDVPGNARGRGKASVLQTVMREEAKAARKGPCLLCGTPGEARDTGLTVLPSLAQDSSIFLPDTSPAPLSCQQD